MESRLDGYAFAASRPELDGSARLAEHGRAVPRAAPEERAMSTAAKPTNVAHGGADILVAEQRPKKVLSGLNFVVDGIGSLRTNTGSAHGCHAARN